jgi:pimeloyl-ACP methyl ester carboxylesterase
MARLSQFCITVSLLMCSLLVNRAIAQTWTSAEDIVAGVCDVTWFSFAVDVSGDWHLAYQVTEVNGPINTYSLYYQNADSPRELLASESFNGESGVGDGLWNPDIAVDNAGNIYVAYQYQHYAGGPPDYCAIRRISRIAQTWTSAEDIVAGVCDVTWFSFAVDVSGDWHLAYQVTEVNGPINTYSLYYQNADSPRELLASESFNGESGVGDGLWNPDIAVDNAGNIYVAYQYQHYAGGPPDYCAIRLTTCRMPVPIFIALGLGDNPVESHSADHLKTWLTSNGYDYVYVVNGLDVCGTPNETYYSGNAKKLADVIRDTVSALGQRTNTNIDAVDIIGHSMGALIARRYASPSKDGHSTWTPMRVRNLIMVGPPNKGSGLSYFPLAEQLGCPGGPAVHELSILSMKKFNKKFADNPSTNYYSFWGRRGLSADCYNNSIGHLLYRPNDGAVSRNSAVRDQKVIGFEPIYTKQHGENWCHSNAGNGGNGNTYLEDETFFAAYIKPILDGDDPFPTSPPPEEDDVPPQIAGEETGSVLAGSSATGMFNVEPNSDLAIALFATDSLIEFSLESPSGVPYTPALLRADPNRTSYADSMGFSGFYIVGAEPGTWEWIANAANATTSPVQYCVISALENSVIINGSQNLEYLTTKDTLILNVSVTDNGAAVPGLTVTALPIWNEQDTSALISLFDDGLHQDGMAADGIYGAYVMPSDSGTIECKVAVSGMAPSGQINRFMQFYALSEALVCGDANGDAAVDISDVVYLIAYIFSGGSAPLPLLAGDANCDLAVDISDVVYLIAYIFSGGRAPCVACK